MSSVKINRNKKLIQPYKVPTGFYSFDRALKGGLVVPAAYEIYGFTHVGKSSLAYALAGKVRDSGKILLADFEHFDDEYLSKSLEANGYNGEVDEADTTTGEAALTDIRDALMNPDYQSAILDSVGALMPKAEIEGDVDLTAQIGMKPRLMSKMMRASMYALKRNAACFFVINHLHPIIGKYRGTSTSGGVAIHNLSAVRIKLKTEKQDDTYSVVQGRIDKLRFGGKGSYFKFVIVPGIGVHPGLTAVQDCIWFGFAEEDRTIKMDGESYGYFKWMVDDAIEGNNEKFEPFIERLEHEFDLGAGSGSGDTEEGASEEVDEGADSEDLED